MRTLVIALSVLAVLSPLVAAAQDQGSMPQRLKVPRDYGGLTPEDRNTYCLWAGDLYSVGASFCYRQTSLATCIENPGKRPTWLTKDNDNLCSKNPSLTPQ